MPRIVSAILVVLAALALLPFACIYRARQTHSPMPRIHLIQGMDNQPRQKSQQVNPLFADTREERPPVEGTVARGRLEEDDGLNKGLRDGKWIEGFPVPVTEGLLKRGQDRFQIYCAPCHGLAGAGDGIVAVRADRLQEGTWVPPSSMHAASVLARPVGHLFNSITNGIRTMPSYGSQIPVDDRWAIVAYVRALQRSGHSPAAVLSAEERAKLVEVAR
jgi:mono/diheme cytochrome c family protein